MIYELSKACWIGGIHLLDLHAVMYEAILEIIQS